MPGVPGGDSYVTVWEILGLRLHQFLPHQFAMGLPYNLSNCAPAIRERGTLSLWWKVHSCSPLSFKSKGASPTGSLRLY